MLHLFDQCQVTCNTILAKVHAKDKPNIQKLLMMPLQQVFVPENYSSLETSIPIYLLANFLESKKQRTSITKIVIGW